MAYQPFDVSIPYYNESEYDGIDASLKSDIYFQADNNASIDSDNSDPSLPALNNLGDISNENFRSADDSFLEEAFPDAVLGESSLIDLPNDPIDENTIVPTAHTGNDATESTTLETDSMHDVPEKINLKCVNIDTQKGLMFVTVHPSQNPRLRYPKEGKRRMKKLDNSDLLTVDISRLKEYDLAPNQSLILRLSLISSNEDDNNPFNNVHIHPDKLRCFSPLVQLKVPKDGSIYVRIQQSNINEGVIKLKDLSIIKTKCNMYNFKLISYSLSEIGRESGTYTIDPKKTTMGNAKSFRELYRLEASRIACQIIIEEGQSLHLTHIACATRMTIAQEYVPKAKKLGKRTGKKPVKRAGKSRKNAKKM